MKLILQPEGSGLCGQCCVAMAAGVSLKRAITVFGHSRLSGTYTYEVITALRYLGVRCADKLKKVSRKRPTLPARAVVVIHRPKVDGKKLARWHWMLTWDGKMYDPGGLWETDWYKDWRITSCLEIFS